MSFFSFFCIIKLILDRLFVISIYPFSDTSASCRLRKDTWVFLSHDKARRAHKRDETYINDGLISTQWYTESADHIYSIYSWKKHGSSYKTDRLVFTVGSQDLKINYLVMLKINFLIIFKRNPSLLIIIERENDFFAIKTVIV